MPVVTRSQTRKTRQPRKPIVGEWEEVYRVISPSPLNDMVRNHEHLKHFAVQFGDGEGWRTTYYQTYGGGPEGGYFVKEFYDGSDDTTHLAGIYEVSRGWGEPFKVRKSYHEVGTRFEYQAADEKAGRPARCRLILSAQ